METQFAVWEVLLYIVCSLIIVFLSSKIHKEKFDVWEVVFLFTMEILIMAVLKNFGIIAA